MASGWWWLLGWFVLAVLLLVAFCSGRWQPLHDEDSAPIRKWPKPLPGESMPEDAVKFAQLTGQCPFCHADLQPGPRGGVMQNMFCLGCNSRTNIATLVREGWTLPPIGQYLGPVPEELRLELFKNQVQKFLDEHPEELDK